MRGQQPSLTARRAAEHRAAHQILEGGAIFADPFALAVLGDDAQAIAAAARADPARRPMRLFVAARSRVAEDALADAVDRGVRQVVVLGAGLDTLALRDPHAGRGVRVFEVDHPATQEWKRRRLAQAGLPVPASLTFAPVDFERDRLADGLRAAGFDGGRPAFFLWLGVVPYLTRATITGTLRFIASVPRAEVVLDYAEPPESLPAGRRARAAELAARTRAAGEPLLSHFEPAELAAELREHGFHEIEDLGPDDLAARFSGRGRDRPPSGGGPHVIRAVRAGAT